MSIELILSIISIIIAIISVGMTSYYYIYLYFKHREILNIEYLEKQYKINNNSTRSFEVIFYLHNKSFRPISITNVEVFILENNKQKLIRRLQPSFRSYFPSPEIGLDRYSNYKCPHTIPEHTSCLYAIFFTLKPKDINKLNSIIFYTSNQNRHIIPKKIINSIKSLD